MDDVLSWFARVQRPDNAAFAATLLCVWICAYLTAFVPRKTPRLVTALALFGINWGVLLLYYLPGPTRDEVLTGVSGLLLLYAGVLFFREAEEARSGTNPRRAGWPDRLPLWLMRPTVGAFGVYVLLRRVCHADSGYGMLALAMWGTVLTILGYGAIWAGMTALYSGSHSVRRVSAALGALLLVYSCCEVAYTIWYARDYWPPYHRYLQLQVGSDAPDFDQHLPFQPDPTWPEAQKWEALRTRPEWHAAAPVMALQPAPRLPAVPSWIQYAYAALKVLFTAGVFALMWLRPETVESGETPWPWLDGVLGRHDARASRARRGGAPG